MVKTVNPRAGSYAALQLTGELLLDANYHIVVSFLDKYPNVKALRRVADGIQFFYQGVARIVEVGKWILQDQRTGELSFWLDSHFQEQFIEPDELQIQRWEKLMKSLEQSQARHNLRSQYGDYKPASEIRDALELCYAVMMQPGWFNSPPAFTVFSPEAFVEARKRAIELYHKAIEQLVNDAAKEPEPGPGPIQGFFDADKLEALATTAKEINGPGATLRSRPVAMIVGDGHTASIFARYLEKTQAGNYEVLELTPEEAREYLKDPDLIMANYPERGINITMDFALVPEEDPVMKIVEQHYDPTTGDTTTIYGLTGNRDNTKK